MARSPITLSQFKTSLKDAEPPDGLGAPLLALWRDAKGDWDGAHKRVDHLSEENAMWVHAYLHRREGDLSNARYWYARAGRTPSALSLEAEWEEIAAALIEGRDCE